MPRSTPARRTTQHATAPRPQAMPEEAAGVCYRRRWGAGSAAMAALHRHLGRGDIRGACGLRKPYGGKASRRVNVTSQPAVSSAVNDGLLLTQVSLTRQTGVREEASAWATGYAAHAWQSPRNHFCPGGRKVGEACQRACPVSGFRSTPGEFTQTPPMLPAAGAAVRSLIGPAIGEQRSIFQAVPGQGARPPAFSGANAGNPNNGLSVPNTVGRWQWFRPLSKGIASSHAPNMGLVLLPREAEGEQAAQPPPAQHPPPLPVELTDVLPALPHLDLALPVHGYRADGRVSPCSLMRTISSSHRRS